VQSTGNGVRKQDTLQDLLIWSQSLSRRVANGFTATATGSDVGGVARAVLRAVVVADAMMAGKGGDLHMKPGDCILFSGGATGAESAFGACAERHGVEEVNFTFDGHTISRTRGVRV